VVTALRALAAVLPAVLLLAATPAGAPADEPTPAQLECQGVTEIVVKRRPGLGRDDRALLRADAGVRLDEPLRLRGTELVRAGPGRLTEALAALNADPDVAYAEPNAPVQPAATDPYFGFQWGLDNGGQDVLGNVGAPDADIDAPEAWSLGREGRGADRRGARHRLPRPRDRHRREPPLGARRPRIPLGGALTRMDGADSPACAPGAKAY
jgi:hypothetical protein